MINMSASAAMQRPSNKVLNVLLSVGGLAALLAGLALVDDRVRLQLAHLVTGQGATGEVGGAVRTWGASSPWSCSRFAIRARRMRRSSGWPPWSSSCS